jgi:hypothetical protein
MVPSLEWKGTVAAIAAELMPGTERTRARICSWRIPVSAAE